MRQCTHDHSCDFRVDVPQRPTSHRVYFSSHGDTWDMTIKLYINVELCMSTYIANTALLVVLVPVLRVENFMCVDTSAALQSSECRTAQKEHILLCVCYICSFSYVLQECQLVCLRTVGSSIQMQRGDTAVTSVSVKWKP